MTLFIILAPIVLLLVAGFIYDRKARKDGHRINPKHINESKRKTNPEKEQAVHSTLNNH